MSDDKITNQPTSLHDGFEPEDLTPKGPFYFMAGLVLLGLVIYLIAFGIYRFLDSYQTAHQPAVSPLVTPEADTRTMTHEETQTFPQPRLEENERTQLRSFIEDQDQKLATYDWVDRDKGILRIPIDRAMELIAKRGLPVHAEGASSAPSSAAKTSTEKTSAAKPSAPVKKQTPKARTTKAAASGN
ncbi:MAG TPA: hypothetical protein VKH18_10615 [Terriglobales bacterium]|nr:hypothetical protein [Terriglobales bacterium]